MTFADLIKTLDVSFQRNDLEDLYPLWVNQALRAMQRDGSFNCMRHRASVTIGEGETSVAMPDDFKELQSARPPIMFWFGEESREIPCDIIRQEELVRMDTAFLWPMRYSRIRPYRYYPVYMDWNDAVPTLNILEKDHTPLEFRVKYFRFLPDLVEAGDTNFFTKFYEEMTKAKVKAVAFEEVGDPASADWEALYTIKKNAALTNDSRQYLVGRRLQMGG